MGKRGFHLNFSKRGVKQTVGLPGSGISQTSYLHKNDPDDETEKKEEAESEEAAPARKKRRTKREATDGRSLRGDFSSSPLLQFSLFTLVVYF